MEKHYELDFRRDKEQQLLSELIEIIEAGQKKPFTHLSLKQKSKLTIKKMTTNENTRDRILVMGVGNVILSNEGVGVHAIEYMQDKPFPDNVDLLDGGTGGFYLLNIVQNYGRIILIDATLDNRPDGSLRLIRPKFSSDFPPALTTHDIGLKDLIETATLLDHWHDIYLITVSITDCQPVGMELSPHIAESLPKIHKMVNEIIEKINKGETDNIIEQ